MKKVLQIDPEFKRLSVPLSPEEERRLENSLIREGCKEPIAVWHGCILDGHKRYEICSYEEIEFETTEIEVATKEEAIIWVCRERMKNLPIESVMYRYLGGRRYACEKKKCQALRKVRRKLEFETGVSQNVEGLPEGRVSIPLAKELGTSHTTVEKYGTFAENMELIAEKDQMMFDVICQGKAVMGYAKVSHLARTDVSNVISVRRKYLREEVVKMRQHKPRNKEEKKLEPAPVAPLEVGIKEMPAFDPDMEFRGLMLTIPTWMNAIARARGKSNIEMVSDSTKNQLASTLRKLEEQITKTLEVIGQ